jgi:thioredoxin reductase
MAKPERPFPPGSYPVVVVGSGPGAEQFSYALKRLGIVHAVLSADEAPGGMFRKWPLFQRLLSWTKPYAPDGPGSPRFERVDWNSLLADEPENRSLQARHMDGTSYFPARAEMEANLADFASRTGFEVRYGCRWESTARVDDGGEERFVLTTSDGDYRCRIAVFAVGVAEPWNPAIPGIELAHHYADVRPANTYAGRRILIIGKRNSGFELASGLLPWAKTITLVSPSPTKLSVVTKSLVGVRARYLQPYEDYAIGGGCAIVDAAIEGIARIGDGLQVTLRRTADSQILQVNADDVINATGFVAPLRDLPKIGVTTFGQNKLPAQTDWWRSASVRGIYFAGTITQGAPNVGKYGIPPNSGAVQGFRYNARILAKHIATTEFGVPANDPVASRDRIVSLLLDDADHSPALWHQRGYLARCVLKAEGSGFTDLGVVPLTTFIDHAGADGVALAIETDGTGSIYPVLYIRKGGSVQEHQLAPSGISGQSTPEQSRELRSVLEALPA